MRDYRNEDEIRRDEEAEPAGKPLVAKLIPSSLALRKGTETAAPAKLAAIAPQSSLTISEGNAKPSKVDRKDKASRTSAKATDSADKLSQDFLSREPGNDGFGHLYGQLVDSARSVNARRAELAKLANSVRIALVDRSMADEFSAAQSIRIWVGVVWGVIAIVLANQIENASLVGAGQVAWGAPLADAYGLQQIFLMLGIAGAGGGFVALLIAAARNSMSNNGIISASDNLGRRIAQLMKEFDGRLSHHRQVLTNESLMNEAVASEVANAHLSGHEAVILFQDVGFLLDNTDASGPDFSRGALLQYKEYLDETSMIKSSALQAAKADSAMIGLSTGSIIGAVVGALVVYVTTNQATVVEPSVAPTALPGIFNYMWALGAILGGLGVFVGAGAIGRSIASLAFAGERGGRLRESLASVRGAITSENAPRSRDIAERVEDLSAIFRTRLAGRKTGTGSGTGGNHGNDSLHESEHAPSWRQRPEGPRFVETGFEAAPKPWLAGPFPDRSGDFFSGSGSGKTGSKRSLFKFGKD